MRNRHASRGRRQTFAGALRALRRPFVALCAVLLVANLVIPVASFASDSEPAAFCHGAAPGAGPTGEGGSQNHRAYQSCCFSAAVALSPAQAVQPALRAGCPQAAPHFLQRQLVATRLPGARQIRAPPVI